jgi:hypothetical protein
VLLEHVRNIVTEGECEYLKHNTALHAAQALWATQDPSGGNTPADTRRSGLFFSSPKETRSNTTQDFLSAFGQFFPLIQVPPGSSCLQASMEKRLPLLKGTITLEEALSEDEDVIQKLSYWEKRSLFYIYLDCRRAQINELVSRHLNVSPDSFQLGEIKEWIHGSFNVCIPIHISRPRPGLPERAIIRFPLPYKTGEEHFPGNVDEKLRCEAATYVWLQRNCPDVPIPRLFGFGFPGTQSV